MIALPICGQVGQGFGGEEAAIIYSQYYRMNKIFEEHAIRLEVNIKEVIFRIATTTKITFSVNRDTKALSKQRKSHRVEGGQCLPFEKHICEMTLNFDPKANSYLSKQLTLFIYSEDKIGRDARRFVKFDPFSKESTQREWNLPVQASSDFKIEFATSFTILSKKSHSPRISSNMFDLFTQGNNREFITERKISAINELIKAEGDSKKESQVKQNFTNKTRKLQNFKSVPIDTKKRGVKIRVASPRYAEESDQTAKPKDQIENLRKKIEIERQEKVRSISKLKMEISPNFLGHFEKNQEGNEVGKLKQKIRNYERKQKSFLTSIEQLTSELQKRKLKIGQLQNRRQDLEKALSERQIKLKSAQSTIRTLNEQLDCVNTKEKASIKKGEAKETALREQIRKLEEKMRLADVEIAKANEEKNSGIKSVQFCEKIHQSALKEKDIKISQEKSKLAKLREQFLVKQKQFYFSLQQLNLKAESLQYEKNQAEERVLLLNESIFNMENQIAALKESMKLQRQQNERKMEENSDKAYGDINSARLKYNDLTSESNLLKEKVKRLQLSKNECQIRIKELEDAIKAKNSEIAKNMNKMNTFKQDLESVNQENIKKAREIESLKQINNNLKIKLAQSKQKYEEERSRKDEANNTLERQANEFNKQAQCYQLQIKDLKWTIVRNNDAIVELEYQIRQENNKILKLNEENMSKTQKYTALEENLRQTIHEGEQLQRQRNSLTLKVKELNDIIRIKHIEIDEERKMRTKAEQRAEDEKEKNKHYINFSKEKQAQESERSKEKDAIILRKQEEINTIQLELTKRRQQITSLKNSIESVLREIQLSKMDNDNIKSQFNLLQSNNKTLKIEYASLTKTYEALNINLTSAQENLAVQLKKYQQLQKQFEQYKQAIERALQNLLVELFKQETNNSNIIAATLFPFPTQKLSTLQIELVQKRNSFIIKSRQRVSDLENQVDLLEHQLQQLNHLYENRQQAAKRQQNEEREKLKGLLYENMLEKNNINEDLVVERKEREQLQKQIEKLKGQIFRRDDIEQQLNGQLQMLILEYEGVKAENQDLSCLLFKHKEMEIKSTCEFEQRIVLLQEESSSQVDKLKVQGLDKENKIIQLEKDLLALNEKMRKLEDQKLKVNGVLQLSKQSNRIQEQKLSFNNYQITKLNNAIKNLQKRQSGCRDSIDRLENEVSQLRNKCQVLQLSLNTTASQHFQTNIEKEKLFGQLTNFKQRCSQLQKILQEKGEITKDRIQKKMEEISLLKSTLIQKTSDIQIKQFHMKQKEQQCQTLTEENQDFKRANSLLKGKIKELLSSIQSSQAKVKEHSRDLEQLVVERMRKDESISQSNFYIMSLQSELEEMSHLTVIVQAKEKQCIQLREAKSQAEEYYMNELRKNKEVISNLKKQIKSHKNNLQNLEDQYKTSLEALSKTSNQRCRSLQTDFLLEKDDFAKKVEEIDAHNKRVVSQFEFRIQKLKEDLEQARQNERNLAQESQKKETTIRSLTKKFQQIEAQLQQFKQKYNRYYHLYLENKAELGQSLKENQSKILNTMEKSKISQLKQYSFKLSELERKLQRLRHSEEMQLKSETLSRRETKLIIERIFLKLSEYIKQAEIEAEELWQASRIDSHLF